MATHSLHLQHRRLTLQLLDQACLNLQKQGDIWDGTSKCAPLCAAASHCSFEGVRLVSLLGTASMPLRCSRQVHMKVYIVSSILLQLHVVAVLLTALETCMRRADLWHTGGVMCRLALQLLKLAYLASYRA